jgi:hypothetical protein
LGERASIAKNRQPTRALPSLLAMELKVECYAGCRADERPLRFAWKPGARTFAVKQVLDQWYGVGYRCFKVEADDGNVYILRHQESEDRWLLESFRRP